MLIIYWIRLYELDSNILIINLGYAMTYSPYRFSWSRSESDSYRIGFSWTWRTPCWPVHFGPVCQHDWIWNCPWNVHLNCHLNCCHLNCHYCRIVAWTAVWTAAWTAVWTVVTWTAVWTAAWTAVWTVVTWTAISLKK